MNVMTVDDFHATIEFDPDLDMFRGKFSASMAVPTSTERIPKSSGPNSSGHSRFFLRFARRKELSRGAIFQASSTYGFPRTCTKSWPLPLRHKARASILWRRRLYETALHREDASQLGPKVERLRRRLPSASGITTDKSSPTFAPEPNP